MTMTGKTIPAPTTTNHANRSPGLSPSVSEPRPRRWRRFQATRSRATTIPMPAKAPPVIHQNRLAMSCD